MKIASKIKPRSGQPRRVTVHDRLYVFAPILDRNEEKHFVAEVKNERAAEALLTSGHFYHYSADFEPQPVLQRSHIVPPPPPPPAPAQTPSPVPPVAPTGVGGGEGQGENGSDAGSKASAGWPPEVLADATELLKGSATEISTAVGKVKHSDVVKAARAIEAQAEKPRANVIKLLDSTLEALKTAGLG